MQANEDVDADADAKCRILRPEQLAANSISSGSIALRHIARNSTPTPAQTPIPAPFPSIRITFQYINIYTQANLCTAERCHVRLH